VREEKKVLSNKGTLNQLVASRRYNNPLSQITQCNRMLKYNIIVLGLLKEQNIHNGNISSREILRFIKMKTGI
jgi:hypothetical protein